MKKSVIILLLCFIGFSTRLYAISKVPPSPNTCQDMFFHGMSIFFGGAGTKIIGGSYTDPLGIEFGAGSKLFTINKAQTLELRTEIKYTTQGGKYEEPMYKGQVKLAYAHLPVMVRYMKNKSGFFAETGLQPGFLVSAKDEYEITGMGKIEDDFKDKVKAFEMGIPIAVGYILKNGLGVSARYVRGLTSVEKAVTVSNVNSFLGLRIFYCININKN